MVLGRPIKHSSVLKMLKENHGMVSKATRTYQVDPNLDFHKMRRHHFSAELLKVMMSKKRILNLDESTYDQQSYYYRTWCLKGGRNLIKKKSVAPAVSLIVIADSRGGIFYSVFQSNSNESTTTQVLYELVELLDAEDSNWRDDTVLI
jgi:hypothetical protein